MQFIVTTKRSAVLTCALALGCITAAAGPIDDLRIKWRETVTGGVLDTANPQIAAATVAIDAAVSTCSSAPCAAGTGAWDTLDRSAGRSWLWSDLKALSSSSDSTAASAEMRKNYDRIRAMAIAYATQGSRFQSNTALRTDILGALEWMQQNRYKPNNRFGNWWDWEIGAPLRLLDVIYAMYDVMDANKRANYLATINFYSPNVNATGANRAWKSSVVLHRAILAQDAAGIDRARKGLSDIDGGTGAQSVFKYVTTGDGFYDDGGFIQHQLFPYAGGYGISILGEIANSVYVLQGSAWAVTDPELANVWKWIGDTYEPAMFKGAFMDMFRGREISRQGNQDHQAGHTALSHILRMAQVAPEAYAMVYKRIVKAEVLADTYRSFYLDVPPEKIRLAQAVLADGSIIARPPLTKHVRMPTMDRVMHHRGTWVAALSMHSKRVANYESINTENMHGWYTAEGMLYLYNGDLKQYSDDFWATVDPYRLPGTTIDLGTRTDGSFGSRYSASDWVGGAKSVDGVSGVVGMRLLSESSGLQGKKSWFMFDNEVVALGAGITNTSNANSTVTVVENRKVAGTNTLRVNTTGNLRVPAVGDTEALTGVNWAHLTGDVTAGQPGGSGDIGYYFPTPTKVYLARVASQGKWSDINVAGSSTPITRNFVQLKLRHDEPSAAYVSEYAYALLPGMSPTAVAAYAASPQFSVLENTIYAQGVRENTLGVTAVNFWGAAPKTVGIITSSTRASVLVRETANSIEVSVSDPTQENMGAINITLVRATTGVASKDPEIGPVATGATTQFTVNPSGTKGRSIRVVFNR